LASLQVSRYRCGTFWWCVNPIRTKNI